MQGKIISSFLQRLTTDTVLNERIIFEMIAYTKEQRASFITYLIKEKKVDSTYLAKFLAEEFFLPFLDLDTVEPLQLPITLIDEKLLRRYQMLPLWRNNEALGLAIVDPSQQMAMDDIRFHIELALECVVVEEEKLKRLFEKIVAQSTALDQKIFSINTHPGWQDEDLTISHTLLNETTLDSETVIIHYVYKLLAYAIRRGASDVHVEPYLDRLDIRFRIDGLLYFIVSLSIHFTQRIITRFKIMSQLDIAERRIPQDGRFQITNAVGLNVDCRINTCPTIHGEKLVIRILDGNKMLLEVDKLGMNATQKMHFLSALESPHGMILVTGPTGSGKTVTLYTALHFLNASTVNISSVENPVEIILSGVNQVNVNPKIGLNFSTVLRAFLRQDPDIIMVGEMRDQETAEIGIKAAQTGHLVLSTLHTNSAAESLLRLASMNIPAYNIVASVQLVIAQRLVRRLCSDCKVEEDLPEKVFIELGLSCDEAHSVSFFSAKGCAQCTEGYRGRTGIFEILPMSDTLRQLMLANYDALAIHLQAKSEGMQTLYSSALEKLKQGEISLTEMKRVIKE